MDFFFTGYNGEALQAEEADKNIKPKLICLAVHDKQTGNVRCIPTMKKRNIRYLGMQVIRFIQSLGHSCVALRNDQEPVLMQLQE